MGEKPTPGEAWQAWIDAVRATPTFRRVDHIAAGVVLVVISLAVVVAVAVELF